MKSSRIKNSSRILCNLLISIFFLAASLSVRADWVAGRDASVRWTNTSGGVWSEPRNWSPNRVPGPADEVVITAAGTYGVQQDIHATIASLTLGGADGTQTLDNHSRTLTLNGPSVVNANGNLVIGRNATVIVRDGALIPNARLTVNGSGSSAGTVDLRLGATLDINGNFTWTGGAALAAPLASIRINPADVCCSVTVNGNVTLANVEIGPFGVVNVAAGQSLRLIGTGTTAGEIHVASAANLSFGGTYALNAGARFSAHPSASIDVSPAEPVNELTVNSSLEIPNLQLLGSINVAAGTLVLSGAGSVAGRLNVAAGAEANFAGSYRSLSGATFPGAGTIRVDPAEPVNEFSLYAAVSIPNLQLGSLGTIRVVSDTLTLAGSGFTAGQISVASGAEVNFIGNYHWNAGTRFEPWTNGTMGMVRISPGETCCAVTVNAAPVAPWTNITVANLEVGAAGVVHVASGTLTLAGDGFTAGRIDVAAGAEAKFVGNYRAEPGASFPGAGSISVYPAEPTNELEINTALTLPNLGLGRLGTIHVLSGTLTLAGNGRSAGTINTDGGNVNFVGNYRWEEGSAFEGAGNIHIKPMDPCCAVTVNGNTSVGPRLEVGPQGALHVASGTLKMNAGGGNEGRFSMGPGAKLDCVADYFGSPTSVLEITIDGRTTPFEITGPATLNGTLQITYTNGFLPTLSDALVVMTYPSHSGTFSNITGRYAGNGLFFDLVYGQTNLLLVTKNGTANLNTASLNVANGHFSFSLTGADGQQYVIYRSIDLMNWLPISTNILSGSTFLFTDPEPANLPMSFYRAEFVTPQ